MSAQPYRRDLKQLTEAVTAFLGRLDALMQEPSTVERGQRIANLCNALEMINDGVRYRSLGINFRTDKKGARYSAHEAALTSECPE